MFHIKQKEAETMKIVLIASMLIKQLLTLGVACELFRISNIGPSIVGSSFSFQAILMRGYSVKHIVAIE
jgi:hypothetical protein